MIDGKALGLENHPLAEAQRRAAERMMASELEEVEANLGKIEREELTIEVVRAITAEDLAGLFVSGVAVVAPRASAALTISGLKAKHHRLAQLVAQGLARPDVAMATGFSTQAIARLELDPAFRALVEHSMAVVDLKFADVVERMKDVGLAALDELKERLAEKGEDFSVRELNEVIDMNLTRPMAASAKARGEAAVGGMSPTINIVFPEGKAGVTIEGEKV